MSKLWQHLKILVGLALLVLLLTACHTASNNLAAQNKSLQIITSTPTYGQMAQQIIGEYGNVKVIMANSNVDPHDFEPTVKNAQQASHAQIAVYNGLGYDTWMKGLLDNNSQVTKINLGNLMHKKMGDNPHLWYDSKALPVAAQKLAQVLSQKDPQHKHYYQKQVRKYICSLDPLQQQIIQIKQQRHNKLVAVSEPVFDYSLQQMGFEIANKNFAHAIEEGSDPSPQDIKQLQQLIKNHEIAFWVDNQQTTNPVVTNMTKLAKQQQIPVIKVTETQPKQLSYSQWLHKEYQKIIAIEDVK